MPAGAAGQRESISKHLEMTKIRRILTTKGAKNTKEEEERESTRGWRVEGEGWSYKREFYAFILREEGAVLTLCPGGYIREFK
jgi:hypothetical protein